MCFSVKKRPGGPWFLIPAAETAGPIGSHNAMCQINVVFATFKCCKQNIPEIFINWKNPVALKNNMRYIVLNVAGTTFSLSFRYIKMIGFGGLVG